MNNIRRIISVIAVLLILVSTAGQNAYAAENNIEESSEEAAADTTAAEEEQEEEELTDSEQDAEDEDQQDETGKRTLISAEAGSFLVEAESADNFKYDNGHLYIYGGTVSVKTRPDVEYSSDQIEVSGYSVLVLSGVRIRSTGGAAIRILPGADVEIRLDTPAQNEGQEEENESLTQVIENYVEGAAGYAGIEAGTLPRGDGSQSLLASLRIKGEGNLTAAGGQGAAAIGGSRGQNACGIIVVEEGNIEAVGGKNADGIGCGADSAAEPEFAPFISDRVSSLKIFTDGSGNCVAGAKESTEDITAAKASMISATFAESGDNSLAGLENVRVRDINGESEVSFDMPAGYRGFAVKVAADSEYMIEQGGRTFGAVEKEDFSGEIEEGDDAAILFVGVTEYETAGTYLAPVQKTPEMDVEVSGMWEDEDNRDGTRPGSVKVTLYANGKETGRTLTLSEENDWSGTFEELAVYSDSTRQSYSVVEERVDGYTGLIRGSDRGGYTITNTHEPLPEGRSSEEEIALRNQPVKEGVIVAKVLTTKVSRSMPVRTSTTIKKSKSAKTADTSAPCMWGGLLLAAVVALFIWMKIEQKKG